MQTRTITVDYARPRGYDVGYRAENNFTQLALPVPTELKDADSYRVYFESTVGEYLQTEPLTPTDGYVTVKITSDIVPEPGNMAAQLVAFKAGEIVGYAPMITGTAKVSIPDGTERLSHSLAAEIALNTAARHDHDNKSVLDKFDESKDGKPTYSGKEIGGAGDFIIKMTVEVNGDNYTVTSCDKTMEQIDAAVASGQNIKAIAFDKYIMPLIQMEYSESYVFAVFLSSQLVLASVTKYPEPGANAWQFYLFPLTADLIEYSNAELPISVRDVKTALDKLVKKSHTHANKDTLDKLSASSGKLTYDGKEVGGADVFTINMAINDAYEFVSCDATFEQVEAAYKAGKDIRVKVSAGEYLTDVFLPLRQATPQGSYVFGETLYFASISATATPEDWTFEYKEIAATDIGYTNESMPNVENVGAALDSLIPRAQVVTGTNITLADNTEYRLENVTTLTLAYPTGNFECWLKLTFAESGSITVTLPAGTKYIGNAPSFANGETWEMSIKDGVVIAQKVGDGT
jgi:hypothetical protein|nr:MAG TPA_asm: hypothetical protein [Caudoviricetes sp.]